MELIFNFALKQPFDEKTYFFLQFFKFRNQNYN